jgi:hypothetical protein
VGLFEVGVEVGDSYVGGDGFFVGLADVDGEDAGSKVGRIFNTSMRLLGGISLLLTGAGVLVCHAGHVEACCAPVVDRDYYRCHNIDATLSS